MKQIFLSFHFLYHLAISWQLQKNFVVRSWSWTRENRFGMVLVVQLANHYTIGNLYFNTDKTCTKWSDSKKDNFRGEFDQMWSHKYSTNTDLDLLFCQMAKKKTIWGDGPPHPQIFSLLQINIDINIDRSRCLSHLAINWAIVQLQLDL